MNISNKSGDDIMRLLYSCIGVLLLCVLSQHGAYAATTTAEPTTVTVNDGTTVTVTEYTATAYDGYTTTFNGYTSTEKYTDATDGGNGGNGGGSGTTQPPGGQGQVVLNPIQRFLRYFVIIWIFQFFLSFGFFG